MSTTYVKKAAADEAIRQQTKQYPGPNRLQILSETTKDTPHETCVRMVKYVSVTSPEMDSIMGRVQGTENRLDVLQENVSGLQENVDGLREDVNGLREEMSDVQSRLSALETKVDGLTEKLDNFIEIATRYVQHRRPRFKTCSMQLLGVR